ncbi:hypothetical protein GCM10027599_08010 [Yimella radicis]
MAHPEIHARTTPVGRCSVGAVGIITTTRRSGEHQRLDKMVRNGEFKQLLEYERAFVLGHEAERTGR